MGVAGIAGTYVTGKAGRDSAESLADKQREHALADRTHAEKREAYVGFLEAINSAARTSLETDRLMVAVPVDMPQVHEIYSQALATVALRQEHVRLVAPALVRLAARAEDRLRTGAAQ